MSLRDKIQREKDVLLGISRFYTPMESGNARYNATTCDDTDDGVVTSFDLSRAFYIYFLEEGTSRSMKHVGFISQRIFPAQASYLYAKYETGNRGLQEYYRENSSIGNYDIYKERQEANMLKLRESRLMASLSMNVKDIEKQYGWEYGTADKGQPSDLNIRI